MVTSLSDVLLALVRATAVLSLSAGLVWGLIRWFKPSSPRLQQAIWLLVLLQGVVLLRWPVEIPWGAADAGSAVHSASAEQPTLTSEIAPPAVLLPAAPSVQRPADVPFAWQPIVFGIWLTGSAATLAWWGIVYLRVAGRRRDNQAPTGDWDAEWRRLLERNGVTAPIHLRVTHDTGPMLVWRSGGPDVLVPRTLWERLASPQRLVILRHELAHFQHGDLWKGALIRLLALPHWFNPLAWWVVKNLDECAEWLCDDAAIGVEGNGATLYAEVLLRLGTDTAGLRAEATGIRGGRLHGRIRRVLTRDTTQRSLKTNLLLVAVPFVLLAAHLVRVELVAAPAALEDATGAAVTTSANTAAPAQPANARTLPRPLTNPEQEERPVRKLLYPTTCAFFDLGVEDAVQFLSDYHGLLIRIDKAALAAARIPLDSPLTLKMEGAPFRRILNRILIPLDLEWNVEGAGLLVTTRIAAARRLEGMLDYELQIIDSLCQLTDPQSQKLRLAGQGDIQRLSDAIQERKLKIQLAKDDEKKVAEVLLEIEQLHQGVETGPFGKDSLFRKSLQTILTPEQLVKYKPVGEVLQAGGNVATQERGGDVFLRAQLTQTAFTDDDLSRLKTLTMLGSLWVELTKVTDAGLIHLKDLPNLRELSLFGTQITDAGMVHLKGLTNLEALVIGGTRVTDAGLVHLKGLTNLQVLNVNYLPITDAGLAHLRGLTKLQLIFLSSTKVTDAGLVDLKRLTKLERLDLVYTAVTDAGLRELQGLPNLQRLNLQSTPITDAGLLELKHLPNLQQLNLGLTQVTDAGLAHIKGMPGLRSLNLQGSKVTNDGFADLTRTMPKLKDWN